MQRPLKFVRYLPEFGWTPVVLTVRPDDVKYVRDAQLLEDVPPAVEVHRTRFFDLRRLPFFRGSLGRIFYSPVEPRLAPGFERLWNPGARRRALGLARERPFDLVFSTSPPASAHLLGRDLHKRLGIPWVIDLRDEWTQDTNRRAYYGRLSPRALARERALEKECVTGAARVVVTSPAMPARLGALLGLPAERTEVITNGYDEADFAGYSNDVPPRGDMFRMVYAGNLATQDPRPFLRAVSRLVETGRMDPTRIDIRFLTTSSRRFAGHVAGVTFEPYRPHRELLTVYEGAHALLLFLESGDEVKIPGKLFEYLRARRPILALVPETGPTAEIVRCTGAGVVAPPDAPEQIEAALHGLYLAWNRRELDWHGEAGEVARYERRALTAALARVFDGAVSGG